MWLWPQFLEEKAKEQKGMGIEEDIKEAVRLWRVAADLGNPIAQYNLGLRYYQGKGAPKDFITACRLYESAAKQGHKPAALAVSKMYKEGIGVIKDETKAKKYAEIGK